jgi:carbon monoxide dehydrogenase subunit G
MKAFSGVQNLSSKNDETRKASVQEMTTLRDSFLGILVININKQSYYFMNATGRRFLSNPYYPGKIYSPVFLS